MIQNHNPPTLSALGPQANSVVNALINAALAQAQAQVTAETSDAPYTPFGNLKKIFQASNPQLIVSGPAGTGKSRAILEKCHRLLLSYPDIRILLVRKSRKSLSESGMQTYEAHVLGDDNPIKHGPSRQHRDKYTYPAGGEFIMGGMDTEQRAKVMSTEYDVIYVQEATELAREDWELLTTRLRNRKLPYQQIIGDVNPGPPTHWIKQHADSRSLLMLETYHQDNPVLFDHARNAFTEFGVQYLATLDRLSGHRRERLRFGRWVAAEGVVYDQWQPRLHLMDRTTPPKAWPRYLSVDFGYQNPFVAMWGATDPDGRLYIYRELVGTQTLVEDWAAKISWYSRYETLSAIICDHDAEGRATLERHLNVKQHLPISDRGSPRKTRTPLGRTLPARKQIMPGIQNVQSRLQVAGDGLPRLFVYRDSVQNYDVALAEAKIPIGVAQEMDSYIWQQDLNGKANKEQPVDDCNHSLDALRYMVMHLDGDPRDRPRAKGNVHRSVSLGTF